MWEHCQATLTNRRLQGKPPAYEALPCQHTDTCWAGFDQCHPLPELRGNISGVKSQKIRPNTTNSAAQEQLKWKAIQLNKPMYIVTGSYHNAHSRL